MAIKILHLKLFHFCQFDSLEHDFKDGMERLKAANGAGKTNCVRGLVYALTSWFDPSWGDQSDMQKDDETAPGYAEVTIQIDGHEYIVRRYTVSATKYPDVIIENDQELVVKRQRVNTWLEERVGVSLPVLAQLMWVRQDHLHWLLTATSANINVFLGLIFDTKKLEKLREHLRRVTEKIADLRNDYQERSEQYTQTLETLPDIDGLEKQLEEDQKKLDHLKELFNSCKNSQTKEQYETRLADITKAETVLLDNISKKQEDLSNYPENTYDATVYEKLQKRSSKLQKDQVAYKVNISSLSTMKDMLKRQLEELQTKDDLKVCQYCGAALQDLEKYRNAKASKLMQKEISYTDALKELDVSMQSIDKAVEKDNKQLDKAAKELEEVKTQLLEQEKLKDSSFQRKLITAEIDKLEHAHKLLLKDKENLEAVPITEQDPDKLALQIQVASETMTTVSNFLTDAKVSKKMAEEGLKQCAEDKKAYERNAYVKRLLTRLREVYSQSRAQARYISSKVDQINMHIDHYLRLSEMPFSLELDIENHVFRYHMSDSDISHPAGMLSGAQKAAASIAVQMALIDVACPELSILLVDEADAALSPENKFIAARLYRTLTDNINGTVVVISQSEAVSDDCDNLWELS